MNDVFVGRLMSSPVHTVSPDESICDAAQTMQERGTGSLVVVDDEERLEGILTATDFVRVAAEDAPSRSTPVDAYMTDTVETATVNESVASVATRIVERGYHHLPVVDDDDAVVGIVSTTDLAAYVSGLDTTELSGISGRE